MNNHSSLLSYLKHAQLSDGSFEHSPFQTSLILVCLEKIKNNTVVQIIARNAISYLLSQVNLQGSWNYRDRTHQGPLLPDDLDDTALALTAITYHAPHLITEEFLLSFVHLLVSIETQEGGPYFTWTVPNPLRSSWDDVDPVVNANIHLLLHLHKIQLEPLETYFETIITEDSLFSKYYSQLHISFFLSKWKACPRKKDLMKILVRTYPKITTLLDRALFVSTYLNLGGDPEKVSHDIKRLARIQPKHLSTDPFYIEEVENGIPTYAGSKVLSAAHIIQALIIHEEATAKESLPKQAPRDRNLIEQVSHIAKKRFADAPQIVQQQLNAWLEKMKSQKKASEIFLLPALWYESLHSKYQKSFSHRQVLDLCVANILGWIGFSIYDDIIDGEQKQSLLPLANLCAQEVSEIFHHPLTQTTLKGIHCTLAWEEHSCHGTIIQGILELPKILPDYGNLNHLAYKSLGHALGPIVLTLPKKDGVRQFFMHYLIARQLNDDAHDWMQDLEQGLINPVGVQVIKKFLESEPGQTSINIEVNREFLQSLFWYQVIDDVAAKIQHHIREARTLIKKLGVLKDMTLVEILLGPLETSANEALIERDRVTKFLENYH